MYLGQDGLQSNLKVYVQYSLLHYQWFSFFSPSAPVTAEENIYLKPDEQMCGVSSLSVRPPGQWSTLLAAAGPHAAEGPVSAIVDMRADMSTRPRTRPWIDHSHTLHFHPLLCLSMGGGGGAGGEAAGRTLYVVWPRHSTATLSEQTCPQGVSLLSFQPFPFTLSFCPSVIHHPRLPRLPRLRLRHCVCSLVLIPLINTGVWTVAVTDWLIH